MLERHKDFGTYYVTTQSMSNNEIGNQQERFLEWFGGIVDGEGCLTFRTRWQKRRFLQVSPVLMVVNTSKDLIDECTNGLTSLNIPFWVTTKHPKNKDHLTIYHLEVSGLKRIAKLLPYLRVRAKRKNANLLKRFTESRLRLMGKEKSPYTKEELGWVKELASMYTRKNPQRLYARLLEVETLGG